MKVENSVFTRPSGIDYRWCVAGAALAGVSMVFLALRCWFFLRGQSIAVGLGRMLELTMIDSLFSLVSFSGLGGDAARIILLIRDHPGKKLAIAMAVMADHLAGLVSLSLIFLSSLWRSLIASLTRAFWELGSFNLLGSISAEVWRWWR
ncbi:MAG: hypothetical protein HC845_01120 [Akkermansiaceae bacterium]|nr:hypothetical protein [Akkermansiaceae bacterium]